MVPEEIENLLSYSCKCRKEKVRCKPTTTSRTLVNNHAYFSTFAYYCAPSSSRRFLAECSEPVLCPETGTVMEKCGTVKRVVKEPGMKWYIWVPVYFSKATGRYYRVLPDFLLPYKHYTANTVKAAQENHQDLDLYDLPSDSSRLRWQRWLLSLHAPASLHYIISYILDPSQLYRFMFLWPHRQTTLIFSSGILSV